MADPMPHQPWPSAGIDLHRTPPVHWPHAARPAVRNTRYHRAARCPSLRSASGLAADAGEDGLYLLCQSLQAVGPRGFEGLLCQRNGLAELTALRLDVGLIGERVR
jgi:hypothetical protein